jgi:MFS family permease
MAIDLEPAIPDRVSPRLPWYRLVAVTIFSLALGVVSNTLEPAVLGHKVLELVPAQKNTALGFTTFAGLIVAILWQPIVGAWSDRTRGPWGRRAPYFVAGTLLVIVCLYAIALAPAFTLVAAGVLLIQLASNTVQGPWQALIPDQVPPGQRGLASGLKAAFDILAFVLGRQLSSRLVAAGSPVGAVSVAAGLFLLALTLTLLAARESPAPVPSSTPGSAAAALARSFAIDWRAHPAFAWWFVNRFLFWAGFIALNTFLLFYVIDVIGMREVEAQRFVGNMSTVLGLVLLVVTLPSGWLADRIGRKPVVAAAGVFAAAGTAAVLIVRTPGLITAAAALLGLSVGMFLSANWALVTDLVPETDAARYLGIANIATAGGSGIARLLGATLIDPLNRLLGSPSAGYLSLYGLAMLAFLAGTLAILRVPTGVSGSATPAGPPG